MVRLTQSLAQWLWDNHRDLISPIMFGHLELFTPEMEQEYLAWCQTDEGMQYQASHAADRTKGDIDK